MKVRVVLLAAGWVAIVLLSASAVRAATMMADGTYQYTLNLNGSSTGTSALTIKRAGSVIAIHEDETISDPSFGTVQASADQTLALATLSPLSFVAAYTSAGKTQDVRLALGGLTGSFIHNGERLTVPVRMLPGTQAMAIQDQALVMSFIVVPALAELARASAFTVAVPTAARTFIMHVDPAPPVKPANVAVSDVGFAIASPVAFAVWLDPRTGLVDEIDVPAQGLIISLTKHS